MIEPNDFSTKPNPPPTDRSVEKLNSEFVEPSGKVFAEATFCEIHQNLENKPVFSRLHKNFRIFTNQASKGAPRTDDTAIP